MLGLVASLKLFHVSINLLNTLAFPLVLAIGVDYGIQFLVVSRREGDLRENLANVLKPLSICGLTTFSGFAVLIPAQNPALSGLGIVCAIGVFWCLLTTFFYMVPAFAYLQRRREPGPNWGIERPNQSVKYERGILTTDCRDYTDGREGLSGWQLWAREVLSWLAQEPEDENEDEDDWGRERRSALDNRGGNWV